MINKPGYFAIVPKLFFNSAWLILLALTNVAAQMPMPITPVVRVREDYTWWYLMLFILTLGLIAAVGYRRTIKESTAAIQNDKSKEQKSGSEYFDTVDSDKELEWMRRNRGVLNKQGKKNGGKKKFVEVAAHSVAALKDNSDEQPTTAATVAAATAADLKDLNIPLPIYSFQELRLARPFEPLPLSNDPALMSAFEQARDEYEEDEEFRDLAVRIMAVFKAKNSVEILSQVALYDLSSNLRSKVVSILGDFDHECVFETILLACADPTREVRAAAARSLSRFSFDRADAWTRIAETREKGRMRQAARAAIEGGLAERIFDWLVHRDPKRAYEAAALLALLIKAGETELIFAKLKENPNSDVSLAILHVIKITNEPKSLDLLYNLLPKVLLRRK